MKALLFIRASRLLLAWLLVHGVEMTEVAFCEELSARSVMERNFYAGKLPHLLNDSTMTLINHKGQERIRKMQTAMILQANGIDSNVLIRFVFPPDIQGTGYLQLQHHDREDDTWTYLPALKKVRRLVANNKKDSFFGSDFSYGDVLLPIVDTYQYSLMGHEVVDGEDCYVIEAVPVSEEIKITSGYSKRIIWVRKSNFMEKQVDYYDLHGRALKTQTIPEVVEIDAKHNKWWARRREVLNHQSGHKTILVFGKLDADTPVSDEQFTSRYLEREK